VEDDSAALAVICEAYADGRTTVTPVSFAQFECEVTGERIRDKIAASKKKGIWMGGVVPIGYRVENRALHVVDEHAAFVRDLFRRYLEIGSVVRLKEVLDEETCDCHYEPTEPARRRAAGSSVGGISIRCYRTLFISGG